MCGFLVKYVEKYRAKRIILGSTCELGDEGRGQIKVVWTCGM